MSGLEMLLALYLPNVGRGNFMADVANRGRNDMLRKVIVTLDLASEVEAARHFRRLDDEAYERSQRAIARLDEDGRL